MLIMVTVGESETNFWFCWRNFQVWPNHGRKKVESHIEDRCSRLFAWRQEKLSHIVPDEHSLILILLCLDLGWNTHSGVYSCNILGVWISDERLHLMFVTLTLDVWISWWNTPSWNFKCFSVFGVIYQTWDAVFHHQMKHREESWKYDAQRSIFDELRGVSFGDETLCRMFDISSQSKSFLKEKLRMQILSSVSSRASDISRKKKQDFAGFSGANSRKNRPISREISGGNFAKKQSVKNSRFRWIFLANFAKIDQFCVDMTSVGERFF